MCGETLEKVDRNVLEIGDYLSFDVADYKEMKDGLRQEAYINIHSIQHIEIDYEFSTLFCKDKFNKE